MATKRQAVVPSIDGLVESVFDVLPTAVMLVSPDRRLVWANRSARAMLRKERALRLDDRLVVAIHDKQDELRQAIEELCASSNTTWNRPRFISVRTADDKRCQIAIIDVRTIVANSSPATLLVVQDPCAGVLCHERALRELYGFTKAEALVAEQIVRGKTVKEAGTGLGISTHTVRAHLKKLFTKTGTTRQAELLLLLGAGVANLYYDREDKDD
jgi:DNA-binding CsgD family transcriptional regulator